MCCRRTGSFRALHAAAEPLPLISQWVQLPARCDAPLGELSASAIEQYERCPLAFKLSRDWCIPEEPAAMLQFGSAMHLALKAYFDGVRAGQPPDEEAVIACFRDEFGKAKIDEDAQRDLYEKDGCEQLRRFLRSDLARPSGEILNNERFFRASHRRHHGEGKNGSPGADRRRPSQHRRLQDRQAQDAGRCRREPAAFHLCAGSEEHGFRRRLSGDRQSYELQLRSSRGARRSSSIDEDARVSKAAANIAAGNFEPNPDRHCRFCSYRNICPAKEDLMLVQPVARTADVN